MELEQLVQKKKKRKKTKRTENGSCRLTRFNGSIQIIAHIIVYTLFFFNFIELLNSNVRHAFTLFDYDSHISLSHTEFINSRVIAMKWIVLYICNNLSIRKLISYGIRNRMISQFAHKAKWVLCPMGHSDSRKKSFSFFFFLLLAASLTQHETPWEKKQWNLFASEVKIELGGYIVTETFLVATSGTWNKIRYSPKVVGCCLARF